MRKTLRTLSPVSVDNPGDVSRGSAGSNFLDS